jgi:hypothetical protein
MGKEEEATTMRAPRASDGMYIAKRCVFDRGLACWQSCGIQ